MQNPIFEPSNLPEIDTADPLAHALLVDPLVAMVGVLLVGLLLMLALNARGQGRKGLIALGIAIILASAMFLTSQLVTTPREVLETHARSLVNSVATGDQTTTRSLMDPDVRVQTRFGGASGIDSVLSLASSRVPSLVKSHDVQEVRADLPGSRIARTMVKVKIDGSFAPSSSWWMVHWFREDPESDDWKATLIEPVWIQGVSNPGG